MFALMVKVVWSEYVFMQHMYIDGIFRAKVIVG